ncbi:MAG: hypothetical protein LBT36_04145, partial [Oscillospiraceae bacterium]|nr:hypothetical protein [Oscillospiraceae bacterium]
MIQIDLTGAARFAAFFSGARVNIDASLDAMEMTGWRGLPARFTAEVSARLRAAAGRVAETSDAFVVVGAGGSSLGARALTDALPDASDAAPQLFFTGDNLSGAHLSRLLNTLRKLDFSISVVSKSGGTLETMMAARALLALLREKYGARAYERVYITAGERDNPLRRFALERGCALFEIPESVGGRYSVLTAAGLLPAAVRGLDLDAIISGAREEAERGADTAFAYASTRRALYAAGYTTEILASFEPDAARVGDWWRQL